MLSEAGFLENSPEILELRDAIIKGEESTAVSRARSISVEDARLAIDALLEAIEIVEDLAEIKEYSQEKVLLARQAAQSVLNVLETMNLVKPSRINGTVGIIQWDAHGSSFEMKLAQVMFKLAGLRTVSLACEALNTLEESMDAVLVPITGSVSIETLQDTVQSVRNNNLTSQAKVLSYPEASAQHLAANLGVDDSCKTVAEAIEKATEYLVKRTVSEKPK